MKQFEILLVDDDPLILSGVGMDLENYLLDKAKIAVSHGYCPECAEKIKEEY